MPLSQTRESSLIKQDRIEVRVTAEQKALLLRAAELSGRTLSELVIASAEQAAEALIRKHQIISLSVKDSRSFADALLNAPLPNAKLGAIAARFKEEVIEEE